MRTSPCSSSPAAGRSPAGDLSEELQGKVDFTAVGAVVAASLPIKSWSVLVAHLGRLEASIPWWLGDVLVFGEHTYGSKYAEVVEATGYAIQTLKNYAWVARSVPVENRDPQLPWRLHREVARLNPRAQREWLDRVRAKGWTTDDLRRELAAAKHREKETPDFKPTSAQDQGRLDRVKIQCPNCQHRFEL